MNDMIITSPDLGPVLMELTKENRPEAVQRELLHAALADGAQLQLRPRMQTVMQIRTPPNVLERRVIAKVKNEKTGKKDKPIYADYVKLQYMKNIMDEHISANHIPRIKVPPQYREVNLQKFDRVEPVFAVTIEMDVYIWGQKVTTIPAVGTTRIKNTAGGLEMAEKGCITDAYKKAYSYLGVCNDVYEYGDPVELNEAMIDMYFADIEEHWKDFASGKQMLAIRTFLEGAVKVRDLRARYWKAMDKMEREYGEAKRASRGDSRDDSDDVQSQDGEPVPILRDEPDGSDGVVVA